MNYKKAWQTVLGQLEMEMPRASYETWLRDTEALSYEDGCLRVGVRTAYARDWLEDRLASTVSRLLIGIMNRTVRVDFVVATQEVDEEEEEENLEEATGGRGLVIDSASSTRYEEEAKPHRVVMFSGYALRLLEHGDLKARDMSLWTAYCQAVYSTQKKTGAKKIERNIPFQEIIAFANMSEATYRRAIAKKDILAGGLVRRLPDQGAGTGNAHFDNATRWEVSCSPRLTSRDAATIKRLLETEISFAKNKKEEEAFALSALQRMAAVHPADWLDDPDTKAIDRHSKPTPTNIKTILRHALGIEDDIPAILFEAAEALQNRLMSAFGKVFISHHFLKVTAPALGLTQPQMWAIISLRDRRYYDHKNKAQYDYIFAENGEKTLADWAGVSEKTWGRWMDDPVFGALVQRVKIESGENEYLDSLVNGGGRVYRLRGDEPPLWFEEDGDTLIPRWTKRYVDADKVIGGLGQSDRRVWTKRYATWDKVIGGFGQSDRCLNNLIKPHLNPNKPHKALPTTLENENSGKISPSARGGGGWDMSSLLTLNPVSNKKIKTQILKKGDPIAFVSWILYAYSSEGKGIDSPSNLAISNIASEPRQAAKAIYKQLARLDPDVLREQIYKLLRPHERYSVDAWMNSRDDETGFEATFGKVSPARLSEMAGCLFDDPLEV